MVVFGLTFVLQKSLPFTLKEMKILKMEVMERNGTSFEWKEGSVEETENHSLKYSEREREKERPHEMSNF